LKEFTTTTYGKWILAGEHAVLRGHPALAFPLLSTRLQLSFEPTAGELDVQFDGPNGQELNLLFYGVLENALQRLHAPHVKGKFRLTSNVPVGTGLGASAALCGAVSRWIQAQQWIAEDQVYEFARQLEDLFHGESSGVDLAVSLSSQGVRFVRGGDRQVVKPLWWPQLYLSYSGRRGITSECVAKVKSMFTSDPDRAAQLDLRMAKAVAECEAALMSPQSEGFALLKSAIANAATCFFDWGLCPDDVRAHLKLLQDSGASAAKPTGSGGGGYVLSLWNHEPPPALKGILLPIPAPAAQPRT
jgi:mevalonate kinase